MKGGMKERRQCECRFAESRRWSSDECGVDNEHAAILYRGSSRPSRVCLDLGGAFGPGDDVAWISLKHVLDSNCRRGRRHLTVHVFCAGDFDELVHVAAARNRDERRVPDVPEDSWLGQRRSGALYAGKGSRDGVRHQRSACAVAEEKPDEPRGAVKIGDAVYLQRQSVYACGTKPRCGGTVVDARVEQHEIGTRTQHCFDVRTYSASEVGDILGFGWIEIPVGATNEAIAGTDCECDLDGRRVERDDALRHAANDYRIAEIVGERR